MPVRKFTDIPGYRRVLILEVTESRPYYLGYIREPEVWDLDDGVHQILPAHVDYYVKDGDEVVMAPGMLTYNEDLLEQIREVLSSLVKETNDESN